MTKRFIAVLLVVFVLVLALCWPRATAEQRNYGLSEAAQEGLAQSLLEKH